MLAVPNSHGQTQAEGSASTQLPTPNSAPAAPQGPGEVGTTPAQSTSPALSPEALARQYIDLWNTGDEKKIESFPAFVMNSVAGRVVVVPGMLMSVISNWRRSMPDLNFKIMDTLVQGDKVAMRTILTGTYKARLFANTADPKSIPDRIVRSGDMMIFQIKDGKIVEIWEEYDVGLMQIQMGGKWCMDVMSKAAPPLGSKTDSQPNAAPTSKPSPKP